MVVRGGDFFVVEGKGTASRGELKFGAKINVNNPNRNRSIGLFASITCHHLRIFSPLSKGRCTSCERLPLGFFSKTAFVGKLPAGLGVIKCATSRIGCHKVGSVPFMSLKKTARTGPVALH